VKAHARCHVADGEFDPLVLGIPEQQNFVCPAQPLGQFSSWRAHAFARRGRTILFVPQAVELKVGGWIYEHFDAPLLFVSLVL
jgi:hypothetical protein